MGSNSLEYLRRSPSHPNQLLRIHTQTRRMHINQHRKEDDQRKSQQIIRPQARFQRGEHLWSFRAGDQRGMTTMPNRVLRRMLPAHDTTKTPTSSLKERNQRKDDRQRPKRLRPMDIIRPSNRQRVQRWPFILPTHLSSNAIRSYEAGKAIKGSDEAV